MSIATVPFDSFLLTVASSVPPVGRFFQLRVLSLQLLPMR